MCEPRANSSKSAYYSLLLIFCNHYLHYINCAPVRRLAQQDAFALLYSLSRYVQHSKTCPISILRPYGEHTSPPAHSLNLICIGKLLIYNRGPHRKHFRWGKHSHPMLTRFFCLHELRMQIRCRKTAIPSKALLLSSAFLLTNPAHSVNKIKDYSRIPSSNAKERYLPPAFRPYNVRSRISYSSQSRLSAPNRN